MPQTILVTGASGFIASHTILELLAHGYAVRGSLRDICRAKSLVCALSKYDDRARHINFVEVRLTNATSWTDAMRGCEGVFHIASPVPIMQPRDATEIIETARSGTLNMLRAATAAGVAKVVMTSSTAAVWGPRGQGSRVYGPSDWSDGDSTEQSPYSRSKTLAERAAWEYVDKPMRPVLAIVNPAIVLGPALQTDYGASLKLLHTLLSGGLPLTPNLGFEMVDVRDVASLHRLAFESSAADGERLMCSAGFRWLREVVEQLRISCPSHAGKLPRWHMPNPILKLVALLARDLQRYVPELGVRREIDTSRTRELLGWQPRNPDEAIAAGGQSLLRLGIV